MSASSLDELSKKLIISNEKYWDVRTSAKDRDEKSLKEARGEFSKSLENTREYICLKNIS